MSDDLTDVERSLHEKIEAAYQEWISEHGLNSAVPRDWIVVVGGIGYTAAGEDVEQIMIIPHGPYYALLGLLVEADTRFRAESISRVIGDDE